MTQDSPLLGVNLKSRKGIQSSWVVEKPIDATSDIVQVYIHYMDSPAILKDKNCKYWMSSNSWSIQGEADDKKQDRWQSDIDLGISIRGREALDLHDEEATERDILHLGQNTSSKFKHINIHLVNFSDIWSSLDLRSRWWLGQRCLRNSYKTGNDFHNELC